MAIELTVEYKRLNAFFADYTKNIGRGGTFIRTDKPLPIGTDFVFRLVVPTLAEPLRLHGRVQWIVGPGQASDEQPPGMGIGFVYSNEAERSRIATVVEGLMSEQLGRPLCEKLLGLRRPRE
ncbi:MAG: TIGR02266 family protein [Sandaracinaceae bacterium]|nr:TIGR02266 family protein [Sandaracinaceae bacterium]